MKFRFIFIILTLTFWLPASAPAAEQTIRIKAPLTQEIYPLGILDLNGYLMSDLRIAVKYSGLLDIQRLHQAVEAASKAFPLTTGRIYTLDDQKYGHIYWAESFFEITVLTSSQPPSLTAPASHWTVYYPRRPKEHLCAAQITLFPEENISILSLSFSHAIADAGSAALFLEKIAASYSGHEVTPASLETLIAGQKARLASDLSDSLMQTVFAFMKESESYEGHYSERAGDLFAETLPQLHEAHHNGFVIDGLKLKAITEKFGQKLGGEIASNSMLMALIADAVHHARQQAGYSPLDLKIEAIADLRRLPGSGFDSNFFGNAVGFMSLGSVKAQESLDNIAWHLDSKTSYARSGLTLGKQRREYDLAAKEVDSFMPLYNMVHTYQDRQTHSLLISSMRAFRFLDAHMGENKVIGMRHAPLTVAVRGFMLLVPLRQHDGVVDLILHYHLDAKLVPFFAQRLAEQLSQ